MNFLPLILYAVASWLCLLAGAVLVCYSAAGVAMVFGKLAGSPWTPFFLVRLGFWSAVFLPAFIVRQLTR